MNRIIELRRKHKIKQKELAACLNWHQARLSNYEHGRREPSLADSRAIVSALNELGVPCTLDEVFPPSEKKQAA
ncbi:helix-turn-helix transcriptional regulator [Aidingimonas halophila]|uniref:Putative transcriptional regulator n=1 Tax=Aidingimonas halophila TaxID=574349 RepID=A0A1H2RHE6_9GAMM|nr:helix-turn-helix transcriptional regulator [Aidingimonas halophila]GHC19299.1 transcriptional regulator [Aidingimonas halophila]SDW18224.1 putative transcriptional regulator [Aidingimonas halophila]